MKIRWALLLLLAMSAPLQAGGRMIIVVGAAGEPEFGPRFVQWADRFDAAAATPGGLSVERIGGDAAGDFSETDSPTTVPATAPASAPAAISTSDREKFHAALLTNLANPTDVLWLVLIGHGTSDGQEAKFNLRGPDVSDKELAEWLKPIQSPLVVLDCTSASGPFLNSLSGKGRVVVTATRAGSEFQYARFGDYLSTAIADPAADLDKDGQTSVLEAFLSASHQVDEFYKQNGRIVTEHALLDDNGDGLGVSADWFQGIVPTRAARTGAPIDGKLARTVALRPATAETALSPERRQKRDAIEAAITALKAQKKSLPPDEYYRKLETLMIDLAKVYESTPATSPAF